MSPLTRISANVSKLHKVILRRGRLDVHDAVEIGRLLEEAKPLCGRKFKQWIQRKCSFSYEQACRYRRLAIFAKTKGVNLTSFENLYQAWFAGRISERELRLEFSQLTPERTVFFDTYLVRNGRSPLDETHRHGVNGA